MCMQVVLACSVLVDAMGSFSPIAAQARRGRKPDSVVLMVGSCSQGLPSRPGADLLYSFVPLNKSVLQSPLFHMVKRKAYQFSQLLTAGMHRLRCS